MRKIFTLLFLLAFNFNNSSAQVAAIPPPPPPGKSVEAQQQKAYDDALLQLNKAIENLNE